MVYLGLRMVGGESNWVARPYLTIECRRYVKKGKRWSVSEWSGFPCDRYPVKSKSFVDRDQVRKFIDDFKLENQDVTIEYYRSRRGVK